jgi:hypothetical protein
MKVKKALLRKGLAQVPINYPAPTTAPFDFEAEKGRVENLCKRLAHNEVEVRDAVLKELPRYIREVCDAATARQAADADADADAAEPTDDVLDALDATQPLKDLAMLFDKLALGLFYCLWHSDKPLVQLECSRVMSELLQCPTTNLYKDLLIRSVFKMLVKYWMRIDHYRLDKYMAFVRKVVFQVFFYLHATVKKEAAAAERKPAASSSTPAKKVKKVVVPEASSLDGVVARSASVLRCTAIFQQHVVFELSTGLTMHVCDVALTELIRIDDMPPALFAALSKGWPLYAMSRGNYVEKRVLDNFIVPVAAGVLEQRSDEFSILVTHLLAEAVQDLAVAKPTKFLVRPMMTEAQTMFESYVAVKQEPGMFEKVSKRDKRQRIAQEIVQAEEMKMAMSQHGSKKKKFAMKDRPVSAKKIAKANAPASRRSGKKLKKGRGEQ